MLISTAVAFDFTSLSVTPLWPTEGVYKSDNNVSVSERSRDCWSTKDPEIFTVTQTNDHLLMVSYDLESRFSSFI